MAAGPRTWLGLILTALMLTGCNQPDSQPPRVTLAPGGQDAPPPTIGSSADKPPRGAVTLAFAGDMHFEYHLAALLDHPRGALGPITRTLGDADLTMVNLESAITDGGTPEAKELEDPSQRFHFRTSPGALDVLAGAGVDVVTMANNHAADYGPVGVRDTLAAIRRGPVPVVGIGRNRRAAFTPYRVSVRGTRFAFLAGDASFREGASTVWAAGPTTPGIAAAHAPRPKALLAAVRAADRRDDVVVVYLHWGAELQACPTEQQRTTASALADAGADIVVGTHAHVQLGSGWIGETYVDYGLGNFLWYHDHQPESGVLRVRVVDGEVVSDSWSPARIGPDGRPTPLTGQQADTAVARWRELRECAGLASRSDRLPPYWSSVHPIGPDLQHRMRYSHGPQCPVALEDLRFQRVTYVGFDDRAHIGEMVLHRDVARDVTRVFHRLYDARWPIRRMRLVDDYRGDDDRSMAANNTSGYNCRRVAGSTSWSDHAYGTAIDINPVQNPYLTGSSVRPPKGYRFATVDRSDAARGPAGVIHANDVVVRAFAEIGWSWGGHWTPSKDYQHFSAPAP
jgi:poly-gamma-glutamate synthesis protein (capsule biosynthesis protein)